MHLIFCLMRILTEFRPLFNRQSFVASCLTQWLFCNPNAKDGAITVDQVCRALSMDWYRPPKLTRGLMAKYLSACIEGRLFSATNDEDTKSTDIQQTLDNAA